MIFDPEKKMLGSEAEKEKKLFINKRKRGPQKHYVIIRWFFLYIKRQFHNFFFLHDTDLFRLKIYGLKHF